MSSNHRAIKRAVEMAGSQQALADLLNKVTKPQRGGKMFYQSHINHWLNLHKQCPASMAIAIERALKGRITRKQLRSDCLWD